jgi:hypothetical protein
MILPAILHALPIGGDDPANPNRWAGGVGARLRAVGAAREGPSGRGRVGGAGQQKYADPVGLASVYAELGDNDQAVAQLEKAFKERPKALSNVQKDPAFDGLRSDKRYADLLRRGGLER